MISSIAYLRNLTVTLPFSVLLRMLKDRLIWTLGIEPRMSGWESNTPELHIILPPYCFDYTKLVTTVSLPEDIMSAESNHM